MANAGALQLRTFEDFSGGLNLRADGFQLADNESPDILNMDVDNRGGFELRRGLEPLNATALTDPILSMWGYMNNAGVSQIMVASGTSVLYSTGGNFVSAFSGLTNVSAPRAATMQNNCYVVNGSGAVRWNGSTVTALGSTFNDNLAAPTGGNLPTARTIATHMGRLWVGYTRESGTDYPHRIRFSHPSNVANTMGPEDWRTNDYIDIDPGVDGDYIVALVPMGERLLVFKRNSIYSIVGADQETFQVFPVTRQVGAVGADAIVSTDIGVFFFHWPTGVYLFDGNNLQYLFANIRPAVEEGSVPDAYADKIALGYRSRRVWVSVPWEASTTNARTFVYSTISPKQGAWVAYDIPVGGYLEWKPAGADALLFGYDSSTAANRGRRVLKLEQDRTTDRYITDDEHIDSHFVTRWFDLGSPSRRKRWKSPGVIASNNEDGTFFVDSYQDWDGTSVVHSFAVTTTAPASTGFIWGSTLWGSAEALWGQDPEGTGHRDKEFRGTFLGTAHSMRLKFRGPAENIGWGVHAVSFRYKLKRIR